MWGRNLSRLAHCVLLFPLSTRALRPAGGTGTPGPRPPEAAEALRSLGRTRPLRPWPSLAGGTVRSGRQVSARPAGKLTCSCPARAWVWTCRAEMGRGCRGLAGGSGTCIGPRPRPWNACCCKSPNRPRCRCSGACTQEPRTAGRRGRRPSEASWCFRPGFGFGLQEERGYVRRQG